MSGTDGATATNASTGTATDTAATSTTATAGTTTTTDAGTGAAAQAAAQTQAAPTVEQLQADVAKWKALSRQNEQAAKSKTDTDAAQKKLLLEVAQKLGIESAGGTPDPAAITAQLEAAQRTAKSSATELTVLRAAARLGADGDALLDSRTFMAQLEGLDGTEAIEAAIKLAVVQAPARYARDATQAARAGETAAASSTAAGAGTVSASTAGDFNGAAGGARQWTEADVTRAKPAEVSKAIDQGLLKTLLGG